MPAACVPGLVIELFDATTTTFVGSRPACGTVDRLALPDPNGRYALQVRSELLATGNYTFAVMAD
jgi:hypothetical protein